MAIIDLMSIEGQKISEDINSYTTLIYGTPKVGKTTFLTSLYDKERTLLIATEKGYKALPGVKVQDCGNWSMFMQIVKQLENPKVKEKFDVVIIDTIDLLYRYAKRFVLGKHSVDKLSDVAWGEGWSDFDTALFEGINRIEKAGYTLAFISHANSKTEKDPITGVEFDKYYPTAKKQVFEIVYKMVDNIVFAGMTKDEDGKEQRILYTRESQQFLAGSRFKHMKTNLPLDPEVYKNALREAVQAEGKGNIKKEREVAYIENETLDFDIIMKELNGVATKLHKEGKLNLLTSIIDKRLGVGAKVKDCKPEQVEVIKIILDEVKSSM